MKAWGDLNPDSIHTLALNQDNLKCGCNELTIQVYNYDMSSSAALIYSLRQSKEGCYECNNLGVTFYNKKTCQCECSSSSDCKDKKMSWFGYPACGCKCTKELKCLEGKYFNMQSCSCDCEPKCCRKGYFHNNITCDCIQTPMFNPAMYLYRQITP